jgi:hypothetical protein
MMKRGNEEKKPEDVFSPLPDFLIKRGFDSHPGGE